MTLAIAPGGVDDLPLIMPVIGAAFAPCFGEAWTATQCIGVLAMPGARLLIARDADVQGFALARTIAGEAELMLLAVAPEHQHVGLGGALLDAVSDDARRSGAQSLFLEVRAGNSAIRLYSSRGFQKVGHRPRYYRGTDGSLHDAITFRLDLL